MVIFFFFFFPSNGGYYLLVRFGLWGFCFFLDRFSGAGSSPSPSRAMVLLLFIYLFFFSGRKSSGSGIGVSPVIAGGAFFFLHLLLKPDLCLVYSLEPARHVPLYGICLTPPVCRLKPWPCWTPVPSVWPACAKDLVLVKSHVWATLHFPGCDWWCPVIPGGRLLQWGS
jgi:hypothetical protein